MPLLFRKEELRKRQQQHHHHHHHQLHRRAESAKSSTPSLPPSPHATFAPPAPAPAAPLRRHIVCRIWLVRHGETNMNRTGIIRGARDTFLNTIGVRQAWALAEALMPVTFSYTVSSDMPRALQTAEIILQRQPKRDLITDRGLRERGKGENEVRNAPSQLTESEELFVRRIYRWWRYNITDHLPTYPKGIKPFDVLVVSHGAFITHLCRMLVYRGEVVNPCNFKLDLCGNSSVSCIELSRDGTGVLTKYSDTKHLGLR